MIIVCEDIEDIDVLCVYNDRKVVYIESFYYLKSCGYESIVFMCVREVDKSLSMVDKVVVYKVVCGRLEDCYMLFGCNDMNDGVWVVEYFYMSEWVLIVIYVNSDEVVVGIYVFVYKNRWDVEIIGEGNFFISCVFGFLLLDLNFE